jgi:hypothetical protein
VKETKKETKKGGKNQQVEIEAAEVKKSNSGIESLVFLLGDSLISLPFEKLSVFKDVEAKSRDVSLQSNYSNLSAV